ncbi:MAG TPA: hypothetical protein VFN67_14250, partial [Polyangiales bacterium]|nr:hypothetical protein [Polyangiales bacterium]
MARQQHGAGYGPLFLAPFQTMGIGTPQPAAALTLLVDGGVFVVVVVVFLEQRVEVTDTLAQLLDA